MSGFTVWPAAPDLAGLVDLCYRVEVTADRRPVIPDGRAGLVWFSDGTLRVCGPETRPWRPERAGIRAVGLRLAMAAAPAVLGVPARELIDRRVHLSRLWGTAAIELTEHLRRTPDPAEQTAVLQSGIRGRQVTSEQIDPVVRRLVDRLSTGGGRVQEIAADLQISTRHLTRRCARALGYPPVVLVRLARFHRFLRMARAVDSRTTLAELAAAAGYADQAHLSRDSRLLTGQRPTAFVDLSG